MKDTVKVRRQASMQLTTCSLEILVLTQHEPKLAAQRKETGHATSAVIDAVMAYIKHCKFEPVTRCCPFIYATLPFLQVLSFSLAAPKSRFG